MKYLLVAVAVAVAVVALSGVTAHVVEAAPAQQIQAYHVVQPGQWLFCIARGYHVNPWTIAYQNGLTNVNFVYPGQTLAIPAGPYWYSPGPTCPPQAGGHPGQPGHPGTPVHPIACACSTYHCVKPGETVSSIAMMYGVNPYSLAQCNGLSNPNLIFAGQNLCIPGGGGYPAQPVHPIAPAQPHPAPHGGQRGHGG